MQNRRTVRGGFALAALAALALVAVVNLSHMSSRRYVRHPRLPHVDANVYGPNRGDGDADKSWGACLAQCVGVG